MRMTLTAFAMIGIGIVALAVALERERRPAPAAGQQHRTAAAEPAAPGQPQALAAPSSPRPAAGPAADGAGGPRAGGPRAEFDTTVIDFGTVPHGTVVSRRFGVRNAGDAPLEIVSLKASCGCTAALESKRVLAPGERGEIEVRFDTSKKTVRGTRQRFTNAVLVQTNAGSNLERLTLTGEVITYYQVLPPGGVVLRPAPAQEPGAAGESAIPWTVVRILPVPGVNAVPASELRLLQTPPAVVVQGPQPITLDGQAGVEFALRVAEGTPPGPIQGALRFATGNPQQPELEIPVRGYVPPPVRAIPSRLALTEAALERPVALEIRATGSTPLRLVRARVLPDQNTPPPLVLEGAAAGQQGTELRFMVRLAAGGSAGASEGAGGAPAALPHGASGRVQLLLDNALQPVLEIPYRIYDTGLARGQQAELQALKLRVSPPQLLLGELAPGQLRQALLTVVDLEGGGRLALADVQAEPAPAIRATLEPLQHERLARIRVEIQPERPGLLAGTVRFRPFAGAEPIAVPVQGVVEPRVHAEPAAVRLVRGGPAATLRLRHAGGELFHVRRVEGAPPGLEVQVRDPERDGEVEVDLRLRAQDAARGEPLYAELALETDLADEPPVVVPVFEGTGP
ncbi:MAG: hypothetical protein KatS3mg102_2870 [Planctomycetota bacterium]|nr:MAG: hypothetical protein KatS3mg102_2870 [Planctomycetota bacterium]